MQRTFLHLRIREMEKYLLEIWKDNPSVSKKYYCKFSEIQMLMLDSNFTMKTFSFCSISASHKCRISKIIQLVTNNEKKSDTTSEFPFSNLIKIFKSLWEGLHSKETQQSFRSLSNWNLKKKKKKKNT